MLHTKVYWIEEPAAGKMGIMPRPQGMAALGDELRALRASGVDLLVSLLEPDEASALGLAGEAEQCRINGLDYLSFPIRDFGVPPSFPDSLDCIEYLAGRLDRSETVVVHCHGGVGRSSLIAAAVLVLRGMDWEQAFDRIGAARGVPVPETGEQRSWLREFSGSLPFSPR